MSDAQTDKAYEGNAVRYSEEWLAQSAPHDIYALFDAYLIKGGTTADIGCGNGRDAAWLARCGYPVTGFDRSDALLAEARHLYPGVNFRKAELPLLDEIHDQFDNVVCETVIMHLAKTEIPAALANLQRILKDGGRLYLSWRATENEDQRSADGRLYSAFTPAEVRASMTGCRIFHFEDVTSESSGKRVCRIIAEKLSPGGREGLVED